MDLLIEGWVVYHPLFFPSLFSGKAGFSVELMISVAEYAAVMYMIAAGLNSGMDWFGLALGDHVKAEPPAPPSPPTPPVAVLVSKVQFVAGL